MPEFRLDIFSTPLWIANSDNVDIRQRAEDLAYSFKTSASDAGLVSEGWENNERSSDQDDFDEKGVTSFFSGCLIHKPEWREVGDFILNMAGALLSDTWNVEGMKIGNMWTTIYPKGAYVPQHVHNNALVSGVFYVKAPQDCGDIVFQDPSWVAKTVANPHSERNSFPGPGTKWTHPVKSGDMVLFPSWLPHQTQKNKSEEDRIIVSFNLLFDDCETLF